MTTDEEILENAIKFDPIETRPQTDVTEMVRRMTQVIPDDLMAVLDKLSDAAEELQWGRGDCANTVWELVQAADLKNIRDESYTFLDVCYFVAVKYTKGQRSYNTIKANALVARRFPSQVREKYHFMALPFSHFAYASRRKFDQMMLTGKYKGKKIWQAILQYSWEVSQKQLYPPSVSLLEEKFEGKRQSKASPYITGVRNPASLSFAPISLPDNGNGNVKEAIASDFVLDLEAEFCELVTQLEIMLPSIVVKVHGIDLASAVQQLKAAVGQIRKVSP